MARSKSLVLRVAVDRARSSHNCQANASHRIKKGDVRLKVRRGRGWDHYCCACAEGMIATSIEKLTILSSMQPEVENSHGN